MAFVPGPNNYVGVLADFLASGFNVFPTILALILTS
jgi:aromatic-L-amino-acid decarboxylase